MSSERLSQRRAALFLEGMRNHCLRPSRGFARGCMDSAMYQMGGPEPSGHITVKRQVSGRRLRSPMDHILPFFGAHNANFML